MSTNLAAGMAKGIATRTLQRVKVEFTTQNNQGINWQDFNYPPCLHIIHFRLSELKKPVKTVVLLLYISFLCIPAICILNCTLSLTLVLSTIIQVATYAKGINMLYTILSNFRVRDRYLDIHSSGDDCVLLGLQRDLSQAKRRENDLFLQNIPSTADNSVDNLRFSR